MVFEKIIIIYLGNQYKPKFLIHNAAELRTITMNQITETINQKLTTNN